MKKLWLLIVLLGSVGFLSAQNLQKDVKLSWSPQTRMTAHNVFLYLDPFGYDATGMYALVEPIPTNGAIVIGPKSHYGITRITPGLEMSAPVDLNLKEGDKEKEFEFTLSLKGNYYVFSSFQNQKLKKSFLFAQVVDKNTLSLKKQLKMVAEVDYSKYNKFKYADFSYALSPDSSKILINYSLLNKHNEILNMGMAVYDNHFNLLWKSDGVSPDKSKIFNYQNYAVNNRGDVFVLGRSFASQKDYERCHRYKKIRKLPFSSYERLLEFPLYHYKVVAVTNEGKNKKDYSLDLPGYFVRQVNITPVNNNELFCSGVYSRPEAYSVLGTCLFKINTKTGSTNNAHTTFTKDILTKGLDDKAAAKLVKRYDKNKEFDKYFYSVNPLIQRKDGGYYLLIEQVERMLESTSDGHVITYFNSYRYDDVFVISLSKSGETEWTRKVDKRTYTTGLYNIYASFKTRLSGNDLYLLYDEMNKKATSLTGVIKRSEAILAKINPDGHIQQKKISSAEKDEDTVIPYYAGYFSPNSMFMLAKNGVAKYRFVRVDFPK